jgi:DNA-binding Lrp family transcriptional regulator
VVSNGLDDLDRQIIHGLYIDGRATFSRLAQVVGRSEQTVARRYRLLRERGVVRVVGQPAGDRVGRSDWMIRLRVPHTAPAVAAALARRPDTAWVSLATMGAEVLCAFRDRGATAQAQTFLGDLPSHWGVTAIHAYRVLQVFFDGARPPTTVATALSPRQIGQLRHRATVPAGDTALRELDWPLIEALAADGRATYRQLAERTHWHESTVRDRIGELLDAGLLGFDLDIDTAVLGIATRAMLWLSISPDRLDTVGRALADHAEVSFAAASTGAANLIASISCSDDAALYAYLTGKVAALQGVIDVETVPIVAAVKRHVSVDDAWVAVLSRR